MTVAELIAKLQEFPPEMRAVITDGEYADYSDICDIYITDGGSLTGQAGGTRESMVVISPFDDGKNR